MQVVLIVHGCIDDYSHRIMYLHCSDNNRAETVFSVFAEGVRRYSLPDRVRGDRGGENIQVAAFMLEHPMRGADRGSFITGKTKGSKGFVYPVYCFLQNLIHGRYANFVC